jgi:presenilin 1
MVLAALSVIFIQTEESQSAGAAEMASYTVFKIDDSGSASAVEYFEQSFLNALVIVCVIATMTFGIVLVYKFRCMMFLIGYMIMSSCTLLGLLGGTMAYVAVEKFRVAIDWFSFAFLLVNFAIVGATAIFFGRGIPMYVTQAYLVCTSVILAWQLSHFDPWTTWALLVMLALYDLCAVLTPCGPLKALVNLMSEDDAPEMPGLLYEAHLGEGIRRPGPGGNNQLRQQRQEQQQPSQSQAQRACAPSNAQQCSSSSSIDNAPLVQPQHQHTVTSSQASETRFVNDSPNNAGAVSTLSASSYQAPSSPSADPAPVEESSIPDQGRAASPENTGFVPLAIARLYKLPPITETTVSASSAGQQAPSSHVVSTSPLLASDNNTPSESLSPEELKAEVEVKFPRNGGKIVRQPSSAFEPKYLVYGRDGEVRRVLIIDPQGRVFQETDDDSSTSRDEEDGPASIRLGLGDFIFYSVLVAQAAAYGFTTFVACMLVILAGLGGTLVLLSVYHKALPALPISIFLGVATYLLTRTVVEPWIFALLTTPYYV